MTRLAHAPKHAPRVPFALLVVTLVAGGLGLLLLLNTASAANEVRRHDLAARDASIAARVQELQNEVAASAAPGNVASAAAELGMVPAGNPVFLVVGPDGSVKVMGSPKPVTDAATAIPAKKSPSKSPKTSQSPTPSHTPSGRTSKSATHSTGSAKRSPGAGGRAAGRSSTPSGASRTPTPTPTPTPTVTLPGGTR